MPHFRHHNAAGYYYPQVASNVRTIQIKPPPPITHAPNCHFLLSNCACASQCGIRQHNKSMKTRRISLVSASFQAPALSVNTYKTCSFYGPISAPSARTKNAQALEEPQIQGGEGWSVSDAFPAPSFFFPLHLTNHYSRLPVRVDVTKADPLYIPSATKLRPSCCLVLFLAFPRTA